MIAPPLVYQSNDLVPVLRELFSQHPPTMNCDPEILARLLYMLRYINRRPNVSEVEAALTALRVEGEAAA